LFNSMKYLAAGYLLYLGVQSIRDSFRLKDTAPYSGGEIAISPSKAFVVGFLTNGLNPKATLFFLALFTVVIDSNTPSAIQAVYGLYLAIVTFLWFSMLSKILGRPNVRAFIIKTGNWVERGMGAILILLALQISMST